MLALWQVFRDQTLKGRVLVLLCHWFLPGCKIVEWLQKHLWQLFWQGGMDLLVCLKYKIFDLLLKWRSVSQTSTEESGKNMFFFYFSYWAWSIPWGHVLSLKHFLPKSCPELSNQVLSFSACQISYLFRVHVQQSLFNFLTSDGQVCIK